MANKPNNPSLWSRAKSMANQKFDVYPSAYANGWAAKWYKSKGGTWRKAEYGMEVMGNGGTPDNPGFNALPPSVQQKIINNMAKGGEKMPEEIARARFAAAGNLDKMSDYGYAYGGYIPEMMYGGKQYMQQGGEQEQVMQIIQMFAQMNQMDPNELMQKLQQLQPEEQQQAIMEMAQVLQQTTSQQPDMTQAAMAYGGYTTGIFAEGGEPNGGMALGQMAAVADKMSKLRQFVSPEQNLDPWIASKLAIMDDSADSISNYMMYNPEAQEGMMEENDDEDEMMMEEMANGGYTVTRSNDRKGKTHKVTGPDGTVKYFGDSKLGQHPKDPERKAAFYARHKKNLDGNPYFRAFARETWQKGGQAPYKPLSEEELSALAHQFRGSGSGKKNYIREYDGIKNELGFLTPREQEQLKKYMESRSGLQSLWESMPNLLGGSGAAGLPGKSRLKDMYRDGMFFRDGDYSSWLKNLESQGYKNGGSTFSGNAWYRDGGEPVQEDYPDFESFRTALYRYNAAKENAKRMAPMGMDPSSAIIQAAANIYQNPPETMQMAEAAKVAGRSAAPAASAPSIEYSGVSIVDLLKSEGKASDYNSRKELASKLGIEGYYGSAKQNLDLIKKITNNPAVLNDYNPASTSRGTARGTTRKTSTSNGMITDTIVNPDGSVTTSEERDPVSNALAQAMVASRPNQAVLRGTNQFVGNQTYDDTYYDSYMLGKIDQDPSSPENIRKRKQAQFAENMLMAVGTAFGPGMAMSAFNTFKAIPGLYRAYKAANAASKVSKAPVKGLLQSPAPTNWTSGSGMYFQMGGESPMEEYKKGGINLDPAKKGTFKAQATRMGMGVQEAASAILNAPEGKYTPKMRKKANFAKNFGKQMGGPVEGEVLDVTPEQLELLRQQGYEFEIM